MGKYDPAPTLAAGLIRTARQKANLTQSDLATACGMTQQAISAYETGRLDPTVQTLLKVVRAAGYDLTFRLEPVDDHDASLVQLLESLPATTRKKVESQQRERVAEARLRRIRGK